MTIADLLSQQIGAQAAVKGVGKHVSLDRQDLGYL